LRLGTIGALISCVLPLAACSGPRELAATSGPSVSSSLAYQRPSSLSEVRTKVLPPSSTDAEYRPPILEPGEATSSSYDAQIADPILAQRQVELNFVDADIREFARVLFSEVLQVPYLIDPNLSGVVTVRSGGRIDGNRALALARQAVEASGATIRLSEGVYRVMFQDAQQFDSSNSRSFNLRFIDASAAQNALQGLIEGRAQIVVTTGQSITVRGDTESLALVASMLEAIDVDQFRKASFGLFPLKFGEAGAIATELNTLYGSVGVSSQTIIPIARINSVLVVASKPEHLEIARKWMERLDQQPLDRRVVSVYQVKNRDAEEVASLLGGIFSGSTSPSAPGPGASVEGQSINAPGSFLSATAVGDQFGITADKAANKLIIRATKSETDVVVHALRRLDTPVSQVYVEATIAEVRLGGELSHGVRWFLQADGFSAGFSDADNGAVAPSYPGFNASLQIPHAEVVISLLEAHTDVRIVSTPQLTVVDRETATIQVGDQVPVVTKSVSDASSGNAVIANDVTFRDTGVILKVTPQIRSSGDVLLDIEQEVSRVIPTTSSKINSPTISQRKVASKVLVPDGAAIVLAGMMSSTDETSQGGLPGTNGTILENIFGSKKKTGARSELIVIIRPVIIRDRSDLREVAAEVAAKMDEVMRVRVN
jgi:general secretion pathway protein D